MGSRSARSQPGCAASPATSDAQPSAVFDPPEMVRWKFAIALLREAGHDPTDNPHEDLRTLLAERDVLRQERDDAIRLMSQYAREAGEAKGRLEMSEAAGIVDGWRERAEAAEKALQQAAAWFEEYADHHQAKGALDKASRNLERANFLRRALSHRLDGQP
jgi:hypothetical protein